MITQSLKVIGIPERVATHEEFATYVLSEDEDGESRRPRKPVPSWARSDALGPVLRAQAKVDPDDIFPNPSKTCSLDAVFTGHKSTGSGKSRRSSSGNWFHDRLTWKEELTYKREMGFVAATNKQ